MKLTAWEHFPYPVRKAWRVMRITTLLILVISLHLSAKTTAQKITLNSNDISIEQFFKQLKKQTGYSFLLENGVISKDDKISVNVKDISLEMVLDQILKPINLSYKIENKTVYILKSSNPTASNDGNLDIPPIDIHGRVTDSLGNPLIGASVTVKGSRKGTETDATGGFTLYAVDSKATLIISFTGYESLQFKIAGKNDIVIQLKTSSASLEEVVINKGYYSTTQELNTGDVSIVTAKTIAEQPISNPLQALEGRVPGLFIVQNTGAPGGAFTVQIRGQGSLINGNDPFYVIDGVPYPSQTLGVGANGNLGNGNPLNYINPLDIESITILKDADATAIYGSRAANGAILITTKKGRAGPVKIDLNAYSGIGNATRDADLLNTSQYLQMRHEAFKNDGIIPTISNAPDLLLWDTTRYTDWQKQLIGNTAHYSDAQINISGGNENTQYLVGFGYHRETTVFPSEILGGGADQKGSTHFNINTSSENKKFRLSFTGSYLFDRNTVQANNFISTALSLPPDAPALYNSDGSLNWEPTSPGLKGTWSNPYANLYNTYDGKNSNVIGNAIFSYTLLQGLDIKASFGYTNTQSDAVATVPTTSYDPGEHIASGYSSFNSTNTHTWIIEPQLNYVKNIGKGILSSLVGGTFSQNISQAVSQNANGFSSDALLNDIQAATVVTIGSSTYTQYKYEAIFGRLNYNLENKYIINLTARRDGSSRFGPGKQFANFGSVGAAWIFSKENWTQNNLRFLSLGKLRASYGTSGNDQIPDYQFIDLYSLTTNEPYQGTQGLYPATLFNPDLAWETSKQLEIGIDLGFLKDRVILNASYYQKRTSNQLISTPLSSVTGFTSIETNLPALIQNSGLELVLNTINIKTGDFRWLSSFNVSANTNKLISYPGLETSGYQNTWEVGKPITSLRVFHSLGVDPTAGVYKFTSTTDPFNPVYPVDATQRVNIAPKYYGGFSNTIIYKRFSLDFLFQFVKQLGLNLYDYSQMPGTENNVPTAVLSRWQNPGDQKPVEMFSQNYGGNAYAALAYYAQYSDFVYSDASYIRLKNLSLSYTLPDELQKRMHLHNFRVYVQGQNLLTITKYLGYDPESQGANLPPIKVWTIGLQISL